MLLHLVALDEEEPTPVRRWQILRDELRRYDTDLLDRPEIVVLTKSDVVDAKALTAVRKAFAKAGVPEVHVISAATRQGVSALIESVWTQLRAHSASPPAGV
jgi:GTP-binding protein